ncbi:LysR family transcriptional regulator [Pseudonocardia humida]|uniref:LysR family transcriptional regulator n=1 Tax=Pseudonocardia humida TaxID=2800819 RepID=A0ABT1A1P1_9PSEU|nr:LysR family transcriptional regulator [Pseudonocardia humida]MCO1656804.1 LysR family transcriptional regulator [Pseudonocardia humida]
MLDAWSLRVLVEVADHGSFSAAAQALSMTQPAVSRQVAGLERRLGVPLFRRVHRGTRPTGPGGVAVELARDVLARMAALEARMGAFGGLAAGELRLSAFPSANAALVPAAIRRFGRDHPGIALSLVQSDPDGPLPAVRGGRVDLALLTSWQLYAHPAAARTDPDAVALTDRDLAGLDLLPLLDERLSVALPAGHPLAGADPVPLAGLRDEMWIEGGHPDCLGPIPQLAAALGGPPRIGFFCEDWNGKQALVAAGAGVTLVPTLARAAVRDGVVLRPTAPELPTRRLYALSAAPPQRLPAVTAMLGLLTELAGALAAGAPEAPVGRKPLPSGTSETGS